MADRRRPVAMPTRRLALVALATFAIVACSSPTASPSGSPGPSANPTASPTPTDAAEGIKHPTGATDVILRVESGGGMIPVDMTPYNVPIFTLYGDGTAIFRNADAVGPESDDGLFRNAPLRAAKLTEGAIQELLAFAVNEGGLGVARERYDNMQVTDMPTTTFFVSAADKEKTVSVYALGMQEPGADAAVLNALTELLDRLSKFDSDGAYGGTEYAPPAYRGILWESGGAPANSIDWPWPEIEPADFVAPAEGGFPRRAFSLEEVADLGLEGIEGGVHGLNLEGPDGKAYSFVLRPLLPDEEN